MKNIAIIFSQIPYGNAKGREGLDAALALSDIHKISVFFIGDGVFHLLPNQNPTTILSRHYTPTFLALDLYDVTDIYQCKEDITSRNLQNENFIISTKIINRSDIEHLLKKQDMVLTF